MYLKKKEKKKYDGIPELIQEFWLYVSRHLWGNSAGNPASATATGEIPWFPNCLCLNFLSSFLLAYLTYNFIIKVQCFQLTENNLIQPLFLSHGSWSPSGFATCYRNIYFSFSELLHSTQSFTNWMPHFTNTKKGVTTGLMFGSNGLGLIPWT